MRQYIIAFLLVATCAAGKAAAQAPDPDTTARHFLIMASIGNLQEVNAGQLAAQQATRSDVKSFGRLMVTDHSQMEQQLLQLAKTHGYQLPPPATDTPPKDPHLAQTKGDDFDRMYIHAMASGHGNTVSMYQNYAIMGKDPAVKAFAQQALPMLKEHLATIKALDEKYKDLSAK